MTTQTEALTLALEALEMYCEHGAILKPIEMRDAIKEALADTKREPVPNLYVKDINGNFHPYKEKGHTDNCAAFGDDCSENHLPTSRVGVGKVDSTSQPEQEPVATAMTAHRAAYFMERFKHEEKLLGPNEQAALDFVFSMLEAQPEPVAHFGSAYVNENGVHITTVLGPVAIPQDSKLYTTPPQPEQEPLEYWNAVEGWVKIDEVREHFDSVGCATIYKTAGEGRVPLSLCKAQPEQEPVAWASMLPNESIGVVTWSKSTAETWASMGHTIKEMSFTTPPQLKEPEQEPVAWMFEFPDKRLAPKFDSAPHGGNWQPLYKGKNT